ncbi:MarR family winged helix-turn-helix transcriptional regulator [Anaerotignum propionicum]|uniref:MarR family winged helix-turn-helix transcriptional regulator n=1 Tax=Anaerotignum propionicum TaxID=28446 RepID=UPI00210C9791|nr:MarR family transcriptional regulator [Anaerotignum propionicum]
MQDNLELMDQFFLVNRLMHRYHHQKNRIAQKESFQGQGRILSLLLNHPGIRQKELSDWLDIRTQSVGEIIMKLETNGYITRTPSEKDRRAMCLYLTEEGVKAARFMEKNIHEAVKIFDCLNDDEKDHLHQYLFRIISKLETKTKEEV